MKKLLIIFILYLLFLLPAISFAIYKPQLHSFMAYSVKYDKKYACRYLEINQGTGKTYCTAYVVTQDKKGKIKNTLTYIGEVQLLLTPGLVDSGNNTMAEGDILATPGGPTGTLTYGNAGSYIGWYILGKDGLKYSFQDVSDKPRTTWSTIIGSNIK